MRCGSMSGKHTLKIDVPAGGTRKTPPHPSWTISPLSLSCSSIDVRQKDGGSAGLLVLVKTLGDADTCFDLPEEGLFASEENREKTERAHRWTEGEAHSRETHCWKQ